MLDEREIRQMFAEYMRLYGSRDDRLTTWFSDEFSGFTGGGAELVTDRAEWVAITRQDFDQVKDPIRLELKDLSVQALAETVAVATGFFVIHLPIEDHILSREIARLVLIFREEAAGWKITHSSISIPYPLVRQGEVYPLQELTQRNRLLEQEVAERTAQLSEANERLRRTNDELAREIAQRRQADDALRRSEELYRSILSASPDDITITDARGGVLMVSPTALEMFRGERVDEYVGRPLTDFLVPEDRARAAAQIAAKRQGSVTGPSEYRALRPDGTTFDVEVNSDFMRDAAGQPTGMVVIVRDITDRRQAEVEREKLEAQNRQLQKTESLGRMAGAIAHHFNNQLQAVIMSLQLAIDAQAENEEAMEELRVAMESAGKAADMSGLMLTYLGQTVPRWERLDLSELCRGTLPLLRAVLPRHLVLEADMPLAGPAILADRNQVRHVLTNLVTNAWEAAGDEAGAIRLSVATVAAADVPTSHRLPVDGRLDARRYVRLQVADSGCGIPRADIDKIFDPFFSTRFPGRGMGLAVTLGIVRAHAGAITVASTPGVGSVFQVYLPVPPEEFAA